MSRSPSPGMRQRAKRALTSRWTTMVILPASVLLWFLVTDPSRDAADTLLRVQIWAQALLITGVAYAVAKSLSGKTGGEELAANARDKGCLASAVAFAGLMLLRGLVLLALLLFFALSARAAGIPPGAVQHLPALRAQLAQAWPDMPQPAYLGALIEHESCITLTSPRCWQPGARLKTQREEGAGFAQLTRAWDAHGRQRFDALAEVRQLDPQGLQALTWSTVYQRPDLQLRAIVVKARATWARLLPIVPGTEARLDMLDAAWNGGLMGVLNERRACAAAPGCDPDQWRGHVERHCLKSRRPLYAGRSACDINRHHVTDVRQVRQPRYTPYLPPVAG